LEKAGKTRIDTTGFARFFKLQKNLSDSTVNKHVDFAEEIGIDWYFSLIFPDITNRIYLEKIEIISGNDICKILSKLFYSIVAYIYSCSFPGEYRALIDGTCTDTRVPSSCNAVLALLGIALDEKQWWKKRNIREEE
jgi:hypothetical protein